MNLAVTDDDWERLGPVLLVGHRGAGKSTLGRRAARRLNRPFFDLDDRIATRCGSSPAELLEDNPQEFRRRERDVLRRSLDDEPTPIIAPGAGLDPISVDALVVWLDRDDWRRVVADSDRPRVRPDLDEKTEWDWMDRTRTPRWRRAAHLRLEIPRGRTIDESTDQLVGLLKWAAAAGRGDLTDNTWFVPADVEELKRARRDAARFGCAGVELRSDVFESPPATPDPNRRLASLRHDDPSWLVDTGADHWDIDVRFADSVAEADLPTRPTRLIVSAHPDCVESTALADLTTAADRLADALQMPRRDVELKYVASPDSFTRLRDFLELVDDFRAIDRPATVLTNNRRFAWLRPILAVDNPGHYLPVGLRSRHPDHPAPMDLGELLPHLVDPPARRFDALVGDPVDHSRGDIWHRRAALRGDEPNFGYLKIPTRRGELDDLLPILEEFPVRGLSITSPLKVEAADSPHVDNPDELPALNTLRRTSNRAKPWLGTDTDTDGMDQTLRCIEEAGIGPGRVVVIGRGGASHAVVRALEDRDWRLVDHLSARAGWQPEHTGYGPLDLIVNAGGPDCRRSEHTPHSRAWVDLHYTDVAAPPPETMHLQGDLLFVAQARAQRRFWHDQ